LADKCGRLTVALLTYPSQIRPRLVTKLACSCSAELQPLDKLVSLTTDGRRSFLDGKLPGSCCQTASARDRGP